ncbi:HDOD domain-containing protein [Alteromonas halophila]|uniref:HDOD domain-containing protein n=1 Tax=Alteromonas halophila TaxID=516698 RepID=A0A918MUE3_9ALTE|nr:HDOD domain-containing protein [Alteromonas halophila]GGW72996.1 hypothetical protein GCM10007391_00660 [Alteromonas halophila]
MAQFDVADLHSQIYSAVISLNTPQPVDSINRCLTTAQRVLSACRHAPDTALAYFTCTLPDSQSPATATMLRSLVLLCLTGRRDHLNEHSLQHLLAATLLAYGLQTNPDYPVGALKKQLKTRALVLWLSILRLSKSLMHPASYQLLSRFSLRASERRVLSCCHLALITPKQTVAHCLREYIRRSPAYYRTLYANWITLPGGLANGHQVVIRQQQRGTVLSVHTDYVAVALSDADTTVCEWLPTTQVMHQNGRAVSFDQWNVLYARHQEDVDVRHECTLYPATFPVHRPPASLTRIIDALHKPDSDIDALVLLIEKEPSFSSFLLNSASLDNRMQLPVNSIKQAILTFGLDRIGDMLVQHALSARLTQHRFPLDGICHQFATLMASVASRLAMKVKTRFTPQSAALTATFLSAPLFTLPDLKVLLKLPLAQHGYYDPNNLLRIGTDTRWQSLSQELASGWHQAATWRALLHHAGKPPASVPASLRREHCILMMAQIISRQWLFGEGTPCSETRNVLASAQQCLDISPSTVTEMQEMLASQLQCPLVY